MPRSRLPCYLFLSVLVFLSILRTSVSTPIYPPGIESTKIESRSHLPHSGLILRISRSLEVITPLPEAFRTLELFYLQVFEEIVTSWIPHESPRDNLFITFGAFQLIFVADRRGKPIPWDVVGDFVIQMVGWSQRGYAATYDRGYWNAARSFGVYVGLRLLPLGAPMQNAINLDSSQGS